MPRMTDTNYAPSPWEPIAEHVERYLATNGDDGAVWEGAPCIILTTTGAKSGQLRRTPLIRVKDGDNYLVVASMGGAPTSPNWYFNMVANPEVTVQDRAEVHELRARVASPEEKAARWPLATAVWPAYDDYQAGTERDIPLVICEPR
jgi:deazaflavin-dependent oxidoreductase (nitroreductase family)